MPREFVIIGAVLGGIFVLSMLALWSANRRDDGEGGETKRRRVGIVRILLVLLALPARMLIALLKPLRPLVRFVRTLLMTALQFVRRAIGWTAGLLRATLRLLVSGLRVALRLVASVLRLLRRALRLVSNLLRRLLRAAARVVRFTWRSVRLALRVGGAFLRSVRFLKPVWRLGARVAGVLLRWLRGGVAFMTKILWRSVVAVLRALVRMSAALRRGFAAVARLVRRLWNLARSIPVLRSVLGLLRRGALVAASFLRGVGRTLLAASPYLFWCVPGAIRRATWRLVRFVAVQGRGILASSAALIAGASFSAAAVARRAAIGAARTAAGAIPLPSRGRMPSLSNALAAAEKRHEEAELYDQHGLVADPAAVLKDLQSVGWNTRRSLARV